MTLQGLIKLADILNRLQGIERRLYVRGKKRRENDLEHSFQLAFFTWYILEVTGMRLDQGRAIKYALIHDLVEAYAGDAPFYFTTKADERKKKNRESAALKRITREFPEFKIGPKYLDNYAKRKDKEAE
jgi:putative hydrolases of HD superfamily